ncbi:MAG: hypothetical protein WAX38_02715 [Minisyncoccia bacterium]
MEFLPFFIFLAFIALVVVLGSRGGKKVVTVLRQKMREGEYRAHPALRRSQKNPLLVPHTRNEWESTAVFNPAAIYLDGKVHLLYRAMGNDGVSRVGYASSDDGIHFTQRAKEPVFTPRLGIGMPRKILGPRIYSRIRYPSGGGWAGCEDPRIIQLGERLYMTFVAFDGWGFIRMAMTTIAVDDFLKQVWDWTPPTLISPPDQIHKNWVIFPEKIHDKYAIMHGVSPEVMIEYVDSLDELDGEKFIQSAFRKIKTQNRWDAWVRGAGPPPVKTKWGWLVIYHAHSEGETERYKLGAMILDAVEPEKVLYRSKGPLLEPDTWYENHGKPGIVYASGAVVLNDVLHVYYGAGDTSVCVATIPLTQLCEAMIENHKPQPAIEPVAIS